MHDHSVCYKVAGDQWNLEQEADTFCGQNGDGELLWIVAGKDVYCSCHIFYPGLFHIPMFCFVFFSYRWGNTPMEEAVHFGHHDVVTILQQYHDKYSPPAGADEKESAEQSLDSLL